MSFNVGVLGCKWETVGFLMVDRVKSAGEPYGNLALTYLLRRRDSGNRGESSLKKKHGKGPR